MSRKKDKRTVAITYYVHACSVDNERGLASGWSNPGLSELGRKQALQLKHSIKGKRFDRVFCSDLRRAQDTAKLVFENAALIVRDHRLREIDYGDLTRSRSSRIASVFIEHIDEPFPNGESCRDVKRRVESFLDNLSKTYLGMHIAVVGHRAPQLALEVLLRGRTWEQAVREDWRVKEPEAWRAGWNYTLET